MMPIRRLTACSLGPAFGVVGLAAFALGAAPAGAASPFGGDRPGIVEVTVRELPADDRWQVDWRLPEKAAGVDFVHGRGFRSTAWRGLPADARWMDAPDVERLCFAKPTREFQATFASDPRRREKDYKLTVSLSDGGRLLYTGQLVVRPLEICPPSEAAAPTAAAEIGASAAPRHRFRLTSDPTRVLRAAGDVVGTGAIRWDPPVGEEATYAYFGLGSAAPGARVEAIADPKLPGWMGQDLDRTLEKILDRFVGETALALPARPIVVVSFDSSGSGRWFDGGALPGMVQLTVGGDGWREPTPEARAAWIGRLAHEFFHLWDRGLLRPDAESEWLSEAAAEAFALRAAYGLGVLDAQQVAARLVDLGNQCLAGLDGQSLLSAPQRQAADTWYSCGPVLLFVAGQAVERQHPGQGGLGLLVREVFAEGKARGGVYGTGLFLGWLDKLSGDRATVFALQGLIRRGVPRGADRLLAQLLTGAGYRVVLAAPSEAKASPDVFGVMLRKALVRCTCGPAGATAGAAVDGDCARLSGPARLASVGDVEVQRDPAAAYERLRAGAGLGRPVRVVAGDDPQPRTLFCGRDALDTSFEQLLRLE
ncbi:MAG TPA: hypothetical protein VFS60_06395 [Thermoanaerobaculia bacterium]|nr:hypothetical protein [Thermoanaerobaculia bacterium]